MFVCVDCLMLHVNGDTSGMDAETEARVSDRSLIPDGYHVACGDSENDHDFSRSSCDLCHSPLGGSRHQMWLLPLR